MPNNYFRFKQFVVYQDKCSMKVCTDACILGAWAADAVAVEGVKVDKCLDVGAGTGLLSLMLIQKIKTAVSAIEIDENAFVQASDNFKRSPWSEQLQAIHANASYYFSKEKYDFIISNPPFYEDDLLSPQKNNNVAKHNAGLNLHEFVSITTKNLTPTGSFVLLLPYHRIDYFERTALENGFFLKQKLLVKPTSDHDFFRGILWFSQTKHLTVTKHLIIKENGNYTIDFVRLMKDYYLNL